MQRDSGRADAPSTRYPGESEPVTEDEYRDALRIAKSIVSWAEAAVGDC